MIPMTADEAFALLSVSRETAERLKAYADLLVKWQARINLVGPSTLPDLWRRHVVDSGQVFRHLPPAGPVVDIGSGAGFPGLVLAILGAGPVHLIESDARKCAFLREAARITATQVTIHNKRIEAVEPFAAGAVTARALAPLDRLLGLAAPFVDSRTHCLFLKGEGVDEELTKAGKDWMMRVERITSLADPASTVLLLREVYRGRH